MKAEEWDAITHFSSYEFPHPEEMEIELISMLSKARDISGIPYKVSSSFRDGDPRTHGQGEGVDIKAATGRQRYLIVIGLLEAGFVRIGIYNKHIHADVGHEDDGFPQRVIWPGKSK